ncbi:MAG: hypothetical protein KDE51_18200 [Anaerolineales bacterium]|nr:hypothetical protein [Anaerolineales bacterium]
MLKKLKELFQTNSQKDADPAALPNPMIRDGLDLTLERTAYYKKSVKTETRCPNCQTTLQTTYGIFMVALLNKGDVADAFAIGDDQIGHFCPNCPTVMLDMTAVEKKVTRMQSLPKQFGIQVLGLLDIDNTDQLEKEAAEYPIIPFHAPSVNASPPAKKTRKPKRKR